MDATKAVADILEHHGIKGMKWGVRRETTVGAQAVVVSDKRRKLKTSGGQGHPAHPDAVRIRTIGQVGKKSGPKALSNADLKSYNERLNLEMNYKRLKYQDSSAGKKFALKIIGQSGQTAVQNAANEGASKLVKSAIVALAA